MSVTHVYKEWLILPSLTHLEMWPILPSVTNALKWDKFDECDPCL